MEAVTLEASSPVMRAFAQTLADAAHHDSPVLFVGETGSGKTTFARALHALSARAPHPFVRVDCDGLREDLAAHVRAARGGTLFLEEVGALPAAGQATALGLLLEGSRASPPEIRLVAGTHRDLAAEIAMGHFRGDLFYRLSVLEIRVPPLRERREDLLPLARAIVADLAGAEGRPAPALSPHLERALAAYGWPGNVRELRSVLERLLILTPGGALDVAGLPARVASTTGA
jgi:DNA-binding NtrC family response regulator